MACKHHGNESFLATARRFWASAPTLGVDVDHAARPAARDGAMIVEKTIAKCCHDDPRATVNRLKLG
jgi:hypothetical protein